MKRLTISALLIALAACGSPNQAAPPAPPQQPYPGGPMQPAYPGAYPPYPQQTQPGYPPPAPAAPLGNQRPLLAPIVGEPMQEAEVRGILVELINHLAPQSRPLVQGIPLVVELTPEVNAYAGCDESGNPFMAATIGIFEAADAISQTKATDELYGTQTYDAYCTQVLPQIVASPTAHSALPAGIIPPQYQNDPRRWSRAHEIFDDVLAFTFGHELAHHYLGHTGCAHGQPLGPGPDPTRLVRSALQIPFFNQFAESAADSAGIFDVLDTGRARRPQYAWSEYGAVTLLDYFARIERAAGGGGPLSLLNPVGVLKTHPNPLLRIPIVQTLAAQWHAAHPG